MLRPETADMITMLAEFFFIFETTLSFCIRL